jgi:hypothetical protein
MADNLTQIIDRVTRTTNNLLKQFRGQPNMEGIAASYGVQFQEIEDMLWDLYMYRWISTAFGEQLDKIGETLGEKRAGRSDDNYRIALYGRAYLIRSNATIEDIYFAVTNAYPGDYRLRELGSAAMKVRLLTAKPGSVDAETLNTVLQANKGAGVDTKLVYSDYDENNTFRWSTRTIREDTTTAGWSDVAKTYGGKRAGVLGS